MLSIVVPLIRPKIKAWFLIGVPYMGVGWPATMMTMQWWINPIDRRGKQKFTLKTKPRDVKNRPLALSKQTSFFLRANLAFWQCVLLYYWMFLLKPALLTDWDPKSNFPQFNEEIPLSLGSLNKTLLPPLNFWWRQLWWCTKPRIKGEASENLLTSVPLRSGWLQIKLRGLSSLVMVRFGILMPLFFCKNYILPPSKKKKH